MPNRNLSADELTKASQLLAQVRYELEILSGGDASLLFAYRRKITKELGYDERGKPMHRRILKLKKYAEQKGICAVCKEVLPETYAELDRFEAAGGYTKENTRIICHKCHVQVQAERRYM